MQKVMIADDEERICQLIEALVDWEALGMEVAAVAHNGLEAARLVRELGPDILITDIRMPGCSGLELIEKVKKSMPELEIIIISGYAHFEYAKSAIKFGVGEYLLKPINRTELMTTLERLKAKIESRLREQVDREQLEQKSKNDVERLRGLLLERLREHREEALFQTLGRLQETYIRELVEQREGDMLRPVRQAKQYIRNHYSEPITQEEVSGIVGLSSTYFSALFKKEEGEGFAKYLTGVRMEQAKILLRESTYSVSEICRRVGYNDLKHFTHNFEKAAGLKPAAYRKLYG